MSTIMTVSVEGAECDIDDFDGFEEADDPAGGFDGAYDLGAYLRQLDPLIEAKGARPLMSFVYEDPDLYEEMLAYAGDAEGAAMMRERQAQVLVQTPWHDRRECLASLQAARDVLLDTTDPKLVPVRDVLVEEVVGLAQWVANARPAGARVRFEAG